MKTRTALVLTIIIGLTVACGWLRAQVASGEVKTKFEKDASLTAEQVKSVIKLMKECGMSEPAQISIGHTQPFNRRFVAVTSAELINGRSVSYDCSAVCYSAWPNGPKDAKARQLGDFWVNPPYFVRLYFAEISVSGKTNRVQVSETVTPELAEKVFGAFASRKVQSVKAREKSLLDDVESWQPGALRYDKERKDYGVSFSGPVEREARVILVGDNIIITWGPEVIDH